MAAGSIGRRSPPVAEMPVSADRPPSAEDNPRHYVFLSDEKPLRKITPANPGDETINVEGVLYHHTRETDPGGRWIYTKGDA